MAKQEIGDLQPELTLPLLSGGEASLDSFLDGHRGMVLVFWSGVCSHCRRYDAYLNDFAARHGELALVVVASRQDESAADLESTISERGLEFPVLHDADREIAHRWLVEQTPRVFLIDGRRRLLYRGAIDNFKYPNDPEHQPYLEVAITDYLGGRRIVDPGIHRRRAAPVGGEGQQPSVVAPTGELPAKPVRFMPPPLM